MGLEADDAEQALRTMARRLLELGMVHESFEAALLARERCSPTGLPLPGRKVAIPHADPEHVIVPVIACAVLRRPVGFREMGNPDRELAVEVIALLGLADHESAQRELVHLLERCQDAAFLDRICASTDPEALRSILVEEVSG